MLITLKQKEIEAALRLYISQRGINLAGKEVLIAFTAGRKESGVSAEVDIEDTVYIGVDPIPPAPLETPAEQAFNAMLLGGTGITMTSVDTGGIYIDAVPPAQPDPTPEPEAVIPAVTGEKKPVSLFN